MTALFERGALISLPALELARTTPPASVFAVDAFDAARISSALRKALDLVTACTPPGRPRLIVARPEMFTDGATLAWLKDAIGGVVDHIALSDGATVRLVPGLRNHVYFYGLGQVGSAAALARLERRAPELLPQIDSQVNTALRFLLRGRRFAPPTQAIVADPPAPESECELRPLTINRHALAEGVAAALGAAVFAPPPKPFARLHYLRLSESALQDEVIARRVSACVGDALADESRAIVWILPDIDATPRSVEMLAQCLLAGGGRPPAGRLHNVFFAKTDLAAQTLSRLAVNRTLIVDDFADFSRAAPDFHESFDKIRVLAHAGRHSPGQFRELMENVYGPQTQIDWLRPHEEIAVRARRL